MEQKNKETYWSRFTDEYEEKQRYVTGIEVISLTKEEIRKEQNTGGVLELGCGTGLYTESLAENATSVTATDFSDEMIAMAQQKRRHLRNVKFLKANALNLDFEDQCFDTVFMANLIHIIGNAERVIGESHRVLKKGGMAIITSFSIDDMRFFNKIGMGLRYLKTFGKPPEEASRNKTTKKSVEQLLIHNDFTVVKSLLLGRKSKSMYITGRKL